MSRETWLMEATEFVRPWFDEHAKPLPESVRVSVGYAKRHRKGSIGVCYNSASAEDGIHQVFISPELDEPVKVLATLLHELVHAADDGVSGHRGEFSRVARALGLEGKMTATVPGEALTQRLTDVAGKLGDYPHGKLLPGMGPVGKQSTRMLKGQCGGCGYIIRLTRKWAEFGMPTCACGSEMELAT